MMKLLINLSTLGAKPTGLGVYTAHCARGATRYFDADIIAPPSYAGDGHVVVRSPEAITLGSGRTAVYRRWLWAAAFRKQRGRFIYSPTHQGISGGADEVLTIHDLITLRFPRDNPLQHLFFSKFLPARLKSARAVIAVSESTRADIHRCYGFPLDRIHVVSNCIDTSVFNGHGRTNDRKPFLLVVGASLSHKNTHEILAQAKLWSHRFQLVIVSSKGKYRRYLDDLVARLKLQDAVRFRDYVTTVELIALYRECAAFVYPSKWEGFGIPILEALACGAPVIASDIAPHREVAAGAAKFVQLGNTASWDEAFASIGTVVHRVLARAAGETLSRYSPEASASSLRDALLRIEPRLNSSLKT